MNKVSLTGTVLAAALLTAGIATAPAVAQTQATTSEHGAADLGCKLTFSLTGWSLIYKHASGKGVVKCANGETLPVKISAKGGGLTAGKWNVHDGTGKFTDVHKITDVLGTYAQGEAHAGLIKSGTAQVLTKGTVSLALAGTGEGIDLGVNVGAFTIKAR